MQITDKESHIIITPTETTLREFYNSFIKETVIIKEKHLLIDFSEKFNIETSEISLFLNIATKKRENGTSFVLVIKGINIDNVPDEINIVPTMIEALDILEMDAIERDLMNF